MSHADSSSASTRRRSRPRSRRATSTPARSSPPDRPSTRPPPAGVGARPAGVVGRAWSKRARSSATSAPTSWRSRSPASSTAWCCSTPTATPVRPAKLWNDTTSAPQADAVGGRARRRALGERYRQRARCRRSPSPSWRGSPSTSPTCWRRATRVMLPHDYLTWRLTRPPRHRPRRRVGHRLVRPGPRRRITAPVRRSADGAAWDGALPRVLGPPKPPDALERRARRRSASPARCSWAPAAATTWVPRSDSGCAAATSPISLGTSGTVFAVSATPTRDPAGAVAGFAQRHRRLSCRWCARSTPPRSPTPSPDGSASTPPGWRDLGDGGRRRPRRRRCSCRTSTASAHRTCPTPPARWSGSPTPPRREQLALAAHDGVLCGLLDGLDALRARRRDVRRSTVPGRRRLAFTRPIGSGSPTCRRSTIVVPDTDETVATGAAVQAAAVASGEPLEQIASRWQLGAGTSVAPLHDGEAVRARYASARLR